MATAALTRSALVPESCPVDFPDVDANGGQLLRVLGPPQFPGWSGEYSVGIQERCALCDQPVSQDFGGNSAGIRFDDQGRPAYVHTDCALRIGRQKVTDMSPEKALWALPPRRNCGLEFDEHDRPMTTIWAAECDLPAPHTYRPATPFRSTNWPFAIIDDSPRYTAAA